MDATATNEIDVSREPAPIRAFLAVRRTRAVLAATILCGALAAWLGTYEASLPSLVEQGKAIIPIWRLLAMGAAVAPVTSLYSQLADLELVATRRLRQYQRIYLGGMGLGCAVIYLGISALTLPPLVLMIIARSWLAWYGLALIAGVALGWRLAWTLPATTAVVLWYWGYQGGDQYRWWEFSARPYNDVPSLLLSLALLAAGLAAYWTTPWRRRRLRRGRWSRSRG